MTATREASEVKAPPASRGRRARLVLAVLAVLVLYLTMTFLNPRVIPRASFLPAPESRAEWYDTCEGRPLNRHTEQWERGTFFWIRSEFSTLVGCIRQGP